jgi:hypothetical protein
MVTIMALTRAIINMRRSVYEWAKAQEPVAHHATGEIVFENGMKVELVDGLVKILDGDGKTFTLDQYESYIAEFERDVEKVILKPSIRPG